MEENEFLAMFEEACRLRSAAPAGFRYVPVYRALDGLILDLAEVRKIFGSDELFEGLQDFPSQESP